MYRLVQKLAQMEEDWDTDLEEKMIEEQSIWEEREQAKKELQEDKLKRLQAPYVGWKQDERSGSLEEVMSWFGGPTRLERGKLVKSGIAKSIDSYGRGELERFLSDNLGTLRSIVRRHGGSEPEYLGSGIEGTAWLLGDGTVLKVYLGTQERYEDELDEIYSKNPMGKHNLMVHEQGSLVSKLGYPISWAVMESFIPLEDLLKESHTRESEMFLHIFNKIGREFHDSFYMVDEILSDGDSEDVFHFLQETVAPDVLEDIYFVYEDQIQNIAETFNLADNWVENLVEQLIVKISKGKGDIHIGNVGLRESTGQLVYFDA